MIKKAFYNGSSQPLEIKNIKKSAGFKLTFDHIDLFLKKMDQSYLNLEKK